MGTHLYTGYTQNLSFYPHGNPMNWILLLFLIRKKKKLKFKEITSPHSYRKHQNLNLTLNSLTSEPAH